MKKLQGEAGNVLLVPVVLLSLLFITAAAFGIWAFGGRQDYKNNSDAKSAAAVVVAEKATQEKAAKAYAEASKNPLKPYVGPDAYGSVTVQYPKTWSTYVIAGNSSSSPLDAYFHTDYVPSVTPDATYNLRVQVTASSYSAVLRQYQSIIEKGAAKATPYSLPKVSSVAGTMLTGNIFPSKATAQGAMVIMPLRDKTLQVWTESAAFLPDFNTYILPNLSFSP